MAGVGFGGKKHKQVFDLFFIYCLISFDPLTGL